MVSMLDEDELELSTIGNGAEEDENLADNIPNGNAWFLKLIYLFYLLINGRNGHEGQ